MQKYKTIDEFLESLDPARREQVDVVRTLILAARPQLIEHIKWNAPSYVYEGEDRITFNVMNKQNFVKLVLHMGVAHKEDKNGIPVLKDDSGIVEWSSDIRGTITFSDINDVHIKSNAIKLILKNWLAISV